MNCSEGLFAVTGGSLVVRFPDQVPGFSSESTLFSSWVGVDFEDQMTGCDFCRLK